jgi:hypothetical protein
MKNIFLVLMFMSIVYLAKASEPIVPMEKEEIEAMTAEEHEARNKVLQERLQEIKAMPKASLEKDQKKDLRKEVREIKKEMKMRKAVSGGIYIGGGALIIIILLILLL